jgi:hypothetical protein
MTVRARQALSGEEKTFPMSLSLRNSDIQMGRQIARARYMSLSELVRNLIAD